MPRAKTNTTNGTSKANEANPLLEKLGIAPELLLEAHNVVRKPRLPYGIVVNNKSAGFLIPEDQKPICNWTGAWESQEVEIQNKKDAIKGHFITGDFTMVCIARSPEYVVYKRDADVEEAGRAISLYTDLDADFDRNLMDVISDYVVIFTDPAKPKSPLHTVPIKIRLKTPVFRISMNQQLDNYYQQVEQAFADLTGTPFSFKSDQWRSLVVFQGNLIGDFVESSSGQGSWCCKVGSYTEPGKESLAQIMFGISSDPESAKKEHRHATNAFNIYSRCADLPELLIPPQSKQNPALGHAEEDKADEGYLDEIGF